MTGPGDRAGKQLTDEGAPARVRFRMVGAGAGDGNGDGPACTGDLCELPAPAVTATGATPAATSAPGGR